MQVTLIYFFFLVPLNNHQDGVLVIMQSKKIILVKSLEPIHSSEKARNAKINILKSLTAENKKINVATKT